MTPPCPQPCAMPLKPCSLPTPAGLFKTQLKQHLLQENHLFYTQAKLAPRHAVHGPASGVFCDKLPLVETCSVRGRAQDSLTVPTE